MTKTISHGIASTASGETPASETPWFGTRLAFLDAYRGFLIFLVISNGLGLPALRNTELAWLAHQFEHGLWTDVTFWDVIHPSFTFIAGVSLYLSVSSRVQRGEPIRGIGLHILGRSAYLVVLSNILSNFIPGLARPVFQLYNVLSQVALGCVLCFLIMQCSRAIQAAAVVLLPALHWWLYTLLSHQQSDYSPLNFVANTVTILFGTWVGTLLRTSQGDPSGIPLILAVAAALSAMLAYVLSVWIPIARTVWTISFTFYSTTWAILLFLIFYAMFTSRLQRYAFPFIILGINSLTVYSVWKLLGTWLSSGLAVFTQYFHVLGDGGYVLHNLSCAFLLWLFAYWIHKESDHHTA